MPNLLRPAIGLPARFNSRGISAIIALAVLISPLKIMNIQTAQASTPEVQSRILLVGGASVPITPLVEGIGVANDASPEFKTSIKGIIDKINATESGKKLLELIKENPPLPPLSPEENSSATSPFFWEGGKPSNITVVILPSVTGTYTSTSKRDFSPSDEFYPYRGGETGHFWGSDSVINFNPDRYSATISEDGSVMAVDSQIALEDELKTALDNQLGVHDDAKLTFSLRNPSIGIWQSVQAELSNFRTVFGKGSNDDNIKDLKSGGDEGYSEILQAWKGRAAKHIDEYWKDFLSDPGSFNIPEQTRHEMSSSRTSSQLKAIDASVELSESSWTNIHRLAPGIPLFYSSELYRGIETPENTDKIYKTPSRGSAGLSMTGLVERLVFVKLGNADVPAGELEHPETSNKLRTSYVSDDFIEDCSLYCLLERTEKQPTLLEMDEWNHFKTAFDSEFLNTLRSLVAAPNFIEEWRQRVQKNVLNKAAKSVGKEAQEGEINEAAQWAIGKLNEFGSDKLKKVIPKSLTDLDAKLPRAGGSSHGESIGKAGTVLTTLGAAPYISDVVDSCKEFDKDKAKCLLAAGSVVPWLAAAFLIYSGLKNPGESPEALLGAAMLGLLITAQVIPVIGQIIDVICGFLGVLFSFITISKEMNADPCFRDHFYGGLLGSMAGGQDFSMDADLSPSCTPEARKEAQELKEIEDLKIRFEKYIEQHERENWRRRLLFNGTVDEKRTYCVKYKPFSSCGYTNGSAPIFWPPAGDKWWQ